jgi:hypothetical protein
MNTTLRNYHEAFDYFTSLINSNNNFAYTRYADGEVALMQGHAIDHNSQAYNVDRWKAPNYVTRVGSQLLETLNHKEDNYYYAISSHTDFQSDNEFLSLRILNKSNITFANLWINANYQKMKQFYNTLQKSVYVICNHAATRSRFPFDVVELFPFPDDCISYWEQYGDDYISQLMDYVSQIQDKTFFISCGPISEIIIHKLYTANPNNQYIDVGSSMDEFVHGYETRPYMDTNSPYSKEISIFSD